MIQAQFPARLFAWLRAHCRPRLAESPHALRRWFVCLALVLAGHLWLLRPSTPLPLAQRHGDARAVQARLVLPPVAPPAAVPQPVPQARPRGPAPAAPTSPSPAEPTPARPDTDMPRPLPDAGHASTRPVAGFALTEGEGMQAYVLSQGDETGEARLDWQFGDGRYRLELQRQLGERALPGWRSEGRWDRDGMIPERFAVLRKGRERQALQFRNGRDPDAALLRTGAGALPEGAQDPLSVWWQLAGWVVAQHLGSGDRPLPRPGLQWQVPLATPRRGLQTQVYELISANYEVWKLRGLPPVGAPPQAAHWELWLDPTGAGAPLRIRLWQGGELRWDMWRVPAAAVEPGPATAPEGSEGPERPASAP